MPDDESSANEPEDRSDETLTPKEAYDLTENKGYMGKTVAKMFDITPGRVSQLKGQYKEGVEAGRESVSPGDFDRESLESALADKEPEKDKYGNECPRCGAPIPTPDSPGIHPCPECGGDIEWGENEI